MAIDRTIAATRNRGSTWEQDLQQISEHDAKKSLARLRERLNREGHASGVLTLHNRSGTGELSLLRKSSFQMKWFVSRDRSRDATRALATLLSKSGFLSEAAQLRVALTRAGSRGRTEVVASELKDMLNRLLPDYPAQDAVAPKGNREKLVNRQGVAPGETIPYEEVDEGADGQLIQQRDPVQQAREEVIGLVENRHDLEIGKREPIKGALSTHQTIIQLLAPKEVKKLGEGSFGAAYLIKGQDGTEKVLKLYQKRISDESGNRTHKAAELMRVTSDRTKVSEAQQRYLYSKNERDKSLRNLARSDQFIVSYNDGSGTKLETLTPLELRELMKRSRGISQSGAADNPPQRFDVLVVGTVMPKAPGDTLTNQNFKDDTPALKRLAGECLDTGEGMVQARIWHRDIKPDNALFDKASGKFTLIDPGLMLKQSKNRPELQTTHYGAGAIRYMHPRVASEKNYSYEADLYSFGSSLLEKSYPAGGLRVLQQLSQEKRDLQAELKKRPPDKNNLDAYRQTESTLKVDTQYLKALVRKEIEKINDPKTGELNKADLMVFYGRDFNTITEGKKAKLAYENQLTDLRRLEKDLDDPTSAAHLIGKIFDATSLPAKDWANQAFALAQYQDLKNHPFVAKAPVQMA